MFKRYSLGFSLLAAFFLQLSISVHAEWVPPTVVEPVLVSPVEPPAVVTPLPIPPLGDSWPTICPIVPPNFEILNLLVKIDPLNPQNERFQDGWRFEVQAIDDDGMPLSPPYYGNSGPDGSANLAVPRELMAMPLVVKAQNNFLPGNDSTGSDKGRHMEIFIPPYCYNQAVWMVGPFEDALWGFYKEAADKKGEAWNPSQVDCASWLSSLQLLIMNTDIWDELEDNDPNTAFNKNVLINALQENQQFLVPTRPPICMAELRASGGKMESGEEIVLQGSDASIVLDNKSWVRRKTPKRDQDPVVVNAQLGTVENLCGGIIADSTRVKISGNDFKPNQHFWMDDENFLGTIHEQQNVKLGLDAQFFNVRLSNGHDPDDYLFDDACALTSVVKISNTQSDHTTLTRDTGVYFNNLFADKNASVYMTSDGDAIVGKNDTWAIFRREGDGLNEEQVFAVELLGHREEDYRDTLQMSYQLDKETLFIGLRTSFELDEVEFDGEKAFLKYTVSFWDGSTAAGKKTLQKDFLNCYEAADPWAKQFFSAKNSHPTPLQAAEFAVRSQCFSASTKNQQWQTMELGFFSINTDKGIHPNLVVNPGWLAPNMAFEVFVQKFDEAVFKGPRIIARTDDLGQLMTQLPTLVEGDRVLLKAKRSCCSDYDLVIPCVSEFMGFQGMPGVPYTPGIVGSIGPIPFPVPGVEPVLPPPPPFVLPPPPPPPFILPPAPVVPQPVLILPPSSPVMPVEPEVG